MSTSNVEAVEVKKEDRRIRKTKRLLRSALTDLLKEKPIQEIKVREIADMVDINRGTFYQHYRDVYDMLNSIEDEIFIDFRTFFSNNSDSLEEEADHFFISLFTYMKENSELITVLLGPNGDPSFIERLENMVRDKCLNEWIVKYNVVNSKEFEYYYAFMVTGCIGLIRLWLNTEMVESPEEMARILERFLIRGATSVIPM